jgi:hypothetical protein
MNGIRVQPVAGGDHDRPLSNAVRPRAVGLGEVAVDDEVCLTGHRPVLGKRAAAAAEHKLDGRFGVSVIGAVPALLAIRQQHVRLEFLQPMD